MGSEPNATGAGQAAGPTAAAAGFPAPEAIELTSSSAGASSAVRSCQLDMFIAASLHLAAGPPEAPRHGTPSASTAPPAADQSAGPRLERAANGTLSGSRRPR